MWTYLSINNISVSFQRKMDDDCITELAVHYGKTKEEMERDVGEVSGLICVEHAIVAYSFCNETSKQRACLHSCQVGL